MFAVLSHLRQAVLVLLVWSWGRETTRGLAVPRWGKEARSRLSCAVLGVMSYLRRMALGYADGVIFLITGRSRVIITKTETVI